MTAKRISAGEAASLALHKYIERGSDGVLRALEEGPVLVDVEVVLDGDQPTAYHYCHVGQNDWRWLVLCAACARLVAGRAYSMTEGLWKSGGDCVVCSAGINAASGDWFSATLTREQRAEYGYPVV